MNQLTEYIIALSNLYGLVNKNTVLEIYNSQNEDQVTIHDIDKLLANPSKELKKAFILTHKDYFVHEAIMENDEFDVLLTKKGDKPHYVLDKSELFKYVDEGYFEETKE